MFKVKSIRKAPKAKGNGAVSPLSKLVIHPTLHNHAVSIAHDGFVRLWDLRTLTEVSRKQFMTPYLTSLIVFRAGFLLGVGNGHLIHLNLNFQTISQHAVHTDCLTDILEHDDHIITVGFDGKVVFLDRNNLMHKCRQIQVDNPIHHALSHGHLLYLAGTPSYVVDLTSFQIKKLGNYLNLTVYQNEVFGASDQHELIRLSSGSHTCLPCSFVFALEKCVVMIFGASIGFMHLNQQNDQMIWNMQKLNSKTLTTHSIIQQHCSILTCVQNDHNHLFFGGENGRLYHIQIQQTQIHRNQLDCEVERLRSFEFTNTRKMTAQTSSELDLENV